MRDAPEAGLSLAEAEGEPFHGRWADWSLNSCRSLVPARGVPAVAALTLRLGERVFEVDLLRLRHPRRLMRAVAQRVA